MADRPTRPLVSLLTDWGARDPSAAICHGVILGIAPDAQIVDISHEVEKYNISHGALMLWSALPYLPVGAHVAVVDPGVGTARRPLALEVGRGDYLVGPDNGLLLPAAERLGGVLRAHAIDNTSYRLPNIAATFHGRDLFAPAAAHLASGVPLDEIGPSVPIDNLVKLDWPAATVGGGSLEATVIYVDTFGNIKLNAFPADLMGALHDLRHGDLIEVGGHTMPWVRTFGDVPMGRHLICADSYGRLCIAQNQGSAAESLTIGEGTRVVLRSLGGDQATE